MQARLKKCQEELDNTSKAFASYRENSKNNMDMVITQLEEMRVQLSEERLQNANLRALCETGKDKLASMKNIMEGVQRQRDVVQKMRTLQDEIITKHEKSVVELNKEIICTYAKLSHSEALLEKANAENRRLRVSEGSARKECDALRASLANQNLVYLGAKELKASRQRIEAEDGLILSHQLQTAVSENKELKQKLEFSEVRLRDQVNSLQACLQRDKVLMEGALAEKATALAECSRAQEQLAQVQRDVLVLRSNKNPTAHAGVQTDAQQELTAKVAQLEDDLLKASEFRTQAESQVCFVWFVAGFLFPYILSYSRSLKILFEFDKFI